MKKRYLKVPEKCIADFTIGMKIETSHIIREILEEAAKQDKKIKHITTPTLVSRIKEIVDEMEPI